jgi:predicted aspartyl protease
MRFSYTKFRSAVPGRMRVTRPLVDVKLIYNGQAQKVRAMIDSGADVCLFHSDIGKILGIDVYTGRKESFSGVSGVLFDVYFHKIHKETIRINTIELEAGFTDAPVAGSGLLGQVGFFDNYQIRFERYKNSFEIYPRSTTI